VVPAHDINNVTTAYKYGYKLKSTDSPCGLFSADDGLTLAVSLYPDDVPTLPTSLPAGREGGAAPASDRIM